MGDVRYGTGTTWAGRLFRRTGARGVSLGVPESVGEVAGSPVIGPLESLHGLTEMARGNIRRGINETLRGVGKAALPAIALAAPEFLPAVVPNVAIGGTLQSGGRKAAEALGADEDTAELVGNATVLGAPLALRGIGRVAKPGGDYLVRQSEKLQYPGIVRAVRRPVAAATEAATKAGLGIAGRGLRFAGPTMRAVGEAFPVRSAIGLIARDLGNDSPLPALRAGRYEAPASSLRSPRLLGPGVLEGEYMPAKSTALTHPRPTSGAGPIPQPESPLRPPVQIRGRGIIAPPRSLPWGPPPRNPLQTFGDLREDQAIGDAMREDLAQHERSMLGEERRAFADRNSMDKPKWLRQAEFQAQKLIQEAEDRHNRPAKYTTTPRLGGRAVNLGTTKGEDLESTLRESIRRARAAKKP